MFRVGFFSDFFLRTFFVSLLKYMHVVVVTDLILWHHPEMEPSAEKFFEEPQKR